MSDKPKLKKVTFVGGPKDGYATEHPEPTVPSPHYLFTISNKTIAYLLIDQDDYEAIYEYISNYTSTIPDWSDLVIGQMDDNMRKYADYGKYYTFTMPAYQWPCEYGVAPNKNKA
jgi:hypothetical protein